MRQSLSGVISVAFVGGLIGRGLRYGLSVVIARGLGAEALGVFAFGMVVMKASGVLARAGLDNAAQKFVPRFVNESDEPRLYGTIILCLGLPLLFGGLLSGTIYVFRDSVFQFIGQSYSTYLPLFLIGVPLFASMMVGVSATQGFKQTKYSVYIRDFGQSGVAVFGAVVGAFLVVDLDVVIAGYVASLAVGTVLSLIFLIRQSSYDSTIVPNFPMKQILTFSGPLVLVAVTQYLISWTDILMLGFFEPAAEVGWYQAAFQTSVLLLVLLQSTNSIFPAVASDLAQAGQSERLSRLFSSLTKWISWLTVLGYLFLVTYAEGILGIFGTATPAAISALVILGAGQVASTVTGPVGYLLMMTGHERLETVNTVLVAFVNLALNFILIQQYGIIGAATATAISLALLNSIRTVEAWHLLGIHPYSRVYLRGIATIGCAFIVMTVGQQVNLGLPATVEILVVGTLSLATFALTTWAIGVSEDDRLLVESL